MRFTVRADYAFVIREKKVLLQGFVLDDEFLEGTVSNHG